MELHTRCLNENKAIVKGHCSIINECKNRNKSSFSDIIIGDFTIKLISHIHREKQLWIISENTASLAIIFVFNSQQT